MIITTQPLNIVAAAAAGLIFGAVFGMAGTFVVQPKLTAIVFRIWR